MFLESPYIYQELGALSRVEQYSEWRLGGVCVFVPASLSQEDNVVQEFPFIKIKAG